MEQIEHDALLTDLRLMRKFIAKKVELGIGEVDRATVMRLEDLTRRCLEFSADRIG